MQESIISTLTDWSLDEELRERFSRFFVFGSVVYRDGDQIMPDKSDVDLVIQFR